MKDESLNDSWNSQVSNTEVSAVSHQRQASAESHSIWDNPTSTVSLQSLSPIFTKRGLKSVMQCSMHIRALILCSSVPIRSFPISNLLEEKDSKASAWGVGLPYVQSMLY